MQRCSLSTCLLYDVLEKTLTVLLSSAEDESRLVPENGARVAREDRGHDEAGRQPERTATREEPPLHGAVARQQDGGEQGQGESGQVRGRLVGKLARVRGC